MKIRKGFVSNSSSSSFCIMGTVIDETETKEFEEKYYKLKPYQSKLDLCYGLDEYSEYDIIVGLHCGEMKDEETLKQFKERVLKELQCIDDTITIGHISWHVDGGYNG